MPKFGSLSSWFDKVLCWRCLNNYINNPTFQGSADRLHQLLEFTLVRLSYFGVIRSSREILIRSWLFRKSYIPITVNHNGFCNKSLGRWRTRTIRLLIKSARGFFSSPHYPLFTANPSFVQIRGNRGNFALVAADVNGIALYDISRDNANPKHPWTLNTAFGEDIRGTSVSGISLIEGPFGTPGNLEVVINGGGRLLHLWRDSAGSWKHTTTRIAQATAVVGFPSLIQTKSGTKGDFELIAPAESGGGLVQLWRNNDNEKHPWSSPVFFGQSLNAVTSVSVIQGPYGNPGNLEPVVISGGKLFFPSGVELSENPSGIHLPPFLRPTASEAMQHLSKADLVKEGTLNWLCLPPMVASSISRETTTLVRQHLGVTLRHLGQG